jgi:hypothetical protein
VKRPSKKNRCRARIAIFYLATSGISLTATPGKFVPIVPVVQSLRFVQDLAAVQEFKVTFSFREFSKCRKIRKTKLKRCNSITSVKRNAGSRDSLKLGAAPFGWRSRGAMLRL